MGIANKVINILVLIAAIGAAVCAFMLWQKREQITQGRKDLSGAIVAAVDMIGPAGQVKQDDMDIKLPADQLKKPIDTLQNNIKKICEQRNKLAETLANVVNKVNSIDSSEENIALEGKDLTDYNAYKEKCEQGENLVAARIKDTQDRNEIMKNGLKKLGEALKIGSEISDSDFLDKDKLNQCFDDQAKRAGVLFARSGRYEKHIVDSTEVLRRAFGKDATISKPELGLNKDVEKELAANMRGINMAAKKYKESRENVDKLKKEADGFKKKLSDSDATIKQKDEEIAELSKNLAAAKAEIERLKGYINGDTAEWNGGADGNGGEKKAIITQASAVNLKKLVGKVTYVNPKYEFVAIDLGTKSTIKAYSLSGRQISRKAPLPQGSVMTVATSLKPEDAQYVARIQVIKVGPDSSIANVIPQPGRSLPKVGDVVFFSDSDIAQMWDKQKAVEAANLEKTTDEEAKDEKEEDGDSGKKDEKAKNSSGSASDDDDEEE